MFKDEIRYLNQSFLKELTSGNIKYAQEQVDKFTRRRVREDGVARRIIPAEPVTPDDYVPQLDSDQPVILVEKEPISPGAIVVGIGDLTPPQLYIRGERYPVTLQVISSSRLRKSVLELETYRADIRQLLAEMLVKDLAWQEDASFFRAVNTALGGSPGATNIMSGYVQWHEMPGGMSRVTIGDAFKRAFEPASRVPITKIVANASTAAELWKWERPEVGDDRAGDILFEGWGDRTLNGCEVILTIKREIIPNDTMYFFGDPGFIGKFYVRWEPSMFIKLEEDYVSFFAREVVGMSIGFADAIHRFDFVTT